MVRAWLPPELRSLTFLVDAGPVFDAYGIHDLPHTILFDSRGEIVQDWAGYSPEWLDQAIGRLK